MKLKNQEVSVGLAKEMKELGVKQDSQRYWVYYTRTSLAERDWKELCGTEDDMEEFELELDYNLCKRVAYIDRISAYTVAELGEMLPPYFVSYKTEYDGWQCESPWGFNDRYVIDSQKYQVYEKVSSAIPQRLVQEAQTEADARAKMVIYLIKEGLLKAEEVGK